MSLEAEGQPAPARAFPSQDPPYPGFCCWLILVRGTQETTTLLHQLLCCPVFLHHLYPTPLQTQTGCWPSAES